MFPLILSCPHWRCANNTTCVLIGQNLPCTAGLARASDAHAHCLTASWPAHQDHFSCGRHPSHTDSTCALPWSRCHRCHCTRLCIESSQTRRKGSVVKYRLHTQGSVVKYRLHTRTHSCYRLTGCRYFICTHTHGDRPRYTAGKVQAASNTGTCVQHRQRAQLTKSLIY